MTIIQCAENGGRNPFLGNFVYPSVTYYNGVTYIAWQGGDNTFDPYITSFNHSTNVWGAVTKIAENPLSADEHGGPALCIDSDGYIHCFYGSHNSAQKHAKSDSPEDISAWTVQADAAISATYPNCIVEGDNIYLFYRTGIAATGKWAYKKSTDKGATWGGVNTIIDFHTDDGVGVYCGNIEHDTTNDRFYMAWNYRFDGTSRRNTYCAYYDVATAKMYALDGTDLGAVISKAEADANCLINDSGTNYSTNPYLHIDNNNYPHLIWGLENGADFDVKYTYWTGSAWAALTTIVTSDTATDAGDFIIRDDGTIEAYIPVVDVGGDMNIEFWRLVGGSWSKETTILTEAKSGDAVYSSSIIKNFDDDLELAFCQLDPGFTNFSLKIYVMLNKILIRNEDEWEFGTKTNIQSSVNRKTITANSIALSYSHDLLDEDCEGTDEADVTTGNSDFSAVTKAGADIIKFETDVFINGSSSIRMKHYVAGNITFVEKNFGSEKGNVWMEVWRRSSVEVGRNETYWGLDDEGEYGFYLNIEDKKIRTYDGADYQYIKLDGTLSTTKADGHDWVVKDTWYNIEIVTDEVAETFDVYLDGVQINAAGIAFRDPANYDGLRLVACTVQGTEASTLYLDGFFVSETQYKTSGTFTSYNEFMPRNNKRLGSLTIDYTNATATYTLTPKILRASDDAVLWTGSAIVAGASTSYDTNDFGTITDDFKVQCVFAGDGDATGVITKIDGSFEAAPPARHGSPFRHGGPFHLKLLKSENYYFPKNMM